jgi:hypothetical protein
MSNVRPHSRALAKKQTEDEQRMLGAPFLMRFVRQKWETTAPT